MPKGRGSLVLVDEDEIREELEKSDSDADYVAEGDSSDTDDSLTARYGPASQLGFRFNNDDDIDLQSVHSQETPQETRPVGIAQTEGGRNRTVSENEGSVVLIDEDRDPSARFQRTSRNMGRRKDKIWLKFETKHKDGKVVSNKCKACQTVVSAKAMRMKNHLESCPKSRQQKDRIESESAVAVPASVPLCSGPSTPRRPVNEPRPYEIFKPRRPNPVGMRAHVRTIGPKAKEEIDMALGRFLYSSNTSFNTVENRQFKAFVKLLNPAYPVPSHDAFGTTILENVYTEVRGIMEKELQGTTGVLLQDGWTPITKESLIGHCIKSGQHTHLLSTSEPATDKSDAEYCFWLIQEAIIDSKNQFDCDIVGVVTDNCNTMLALQRLIRDNYPDIEAIGCNSHLFNLLGKHFTSEEVKVQVNMVQVFMKGHSFTAASLKAKGGRKPILPGCTRWNSHIDSFLNYNHNHAIYLCIAREMKKRTDLDPVAQAKLDEVMNILNDTDVYKNVEAAVKTLEPICRALDAAQQDNAT